MISHSVLVLVLVLSFKLVQEVTSIVHYVNPDVENITNDHTLTYYQDHDMMSSSDTHLYFQPGLFHLRKPIIISHVTNYSFMGSANGETVIICERLKAGILINNSVNVVISNISIKYCDYDFKIPYRNSPGISNLMILACESLFIQNSTFLAKYYQHIGLSIYDPMGLSNLIQVNSSSLFIGVYNVSMDSCTVIAQFHGISNTNWPVISLALHDHHQTVNITLSNTIIKQPRAIGIAVRTCTSSNTIYIDNLYLVSDNWHKSNIPKSSGVISIYFKVPCMAVSRNVSYMTYIQFNSCQFVNIIKDTRLFAIMTYQTSTDLYPFVVHIKNSSFLNITKTRIIHSNVFEPKERKPLVTLILTNSTFKDINTSYVIDLLETRLIIQGPVYFSKINILKDHLLKVDKDTIKTENYVEFSFINSNILIYATYIALETSTVVNFTSNNFNVGILFPKIKDVIRYLLCAFQYIDTTNKHIDSHNFSVIFRKNSGNRLFSKRYSTTHCDWIEQSVHLASDPVVINEQLIEYTNNSFGVHTFYNQICLCTDAENYSCTADELELAYPGQKYSLGLIAKNVSAPIVNVQIDESPLTACRTQTKLMGINIFQNNCTTINFTIEFINRRNCEIYLRGKSSSYLVFNEFDILHMQSNQQLLNIYRISMIPCPFGFTLNVAEGFCQCDPLLRQKLVYIDCDIDNQAILRPANSWILASTANNSYTYDVSLECPFDYCLPYRSYINLATPDLQCQFNRYGVLCGHCPPGYSAVFGSSQCKRCSNVYLLIIIPIAIAEIVLVFLLFLLNLTVTDGCITPFIYYVNIVSINSAVFFSEHHSPYTQFTYAFVSIANLDLGIETCFYNGMTGYGKIFLQLVFPFYLILIAILLIVASRYSTRIQRLTARRALPVLATLFILSYTKILQTVCMALFFYSSVFHLPGSHATVMWSVDTSTKIFEIKFILLFVVSVMLFLILMMFNIVLIFTRSFSCFKVINHFKPLLDACHGPFKDKFYYWTGLQLATRAIYFGISALDKSTHLVIGITLLCIITGLHVHLHPFRTKDKAIQEFLFLLNLQGLFLTRIYTATSSIPINILITIAAIHFGFIMANQIKVNILPIRIQQLLDSSPVRCNLVCRESHEPLQHNVELDIMRAEREDVDDYSEFQESLLAVDL